MNDKSNEVNKKVSLKSAIIAFYNIHDCVFLLLIFFSLSLMKLWLFLFLVGCFCAEFVSNVYIANDGSTFYLFFSNISVLYVNTYGTFNYDITFTRYILLYNTVFYYLAHSSSGSYGFNVENIHTVSITLTNNNFQYTDSITTLENNVFTIFNTWLLY